jgi:hypothetical protein
MFEPMFFSGAIVIGIVITVLAMAAALTLVIMWTLAVWRKFRRRREQRKIEMEFPRDAHWWGRR